MAKKTPAAVAPSAAPSPRFPLHPGPTASWFENPPTPNANVFFNLSFEEWCSLVGMPIPTTKDSVSYNTWLALGQALRQAVCPQNPLVRTINTLHEEVWVSTIMPKEEKPSRRHQVSWDVS